MKITRSTKCSFKFATKSKREQLRRVLVEYGRVVNQFIDNFWENVPDKRELLKPILDSVDSWFALRMKKVAAREAVDMIKGAQKRWGKKTAKPNHRGKSIQGSASIAELRLPKTASEFDSWLHLYCIGRRTILDFPIRLHKHFHKLNTKGKRLESYIITEQGVQFVFEITVQPKKKPQRLAGVDTGINFLASLSNGQQLGNEIWKAIQRIRRCKHGSKGQKRATRALRHYIDETARDVARQIDLVVVERLTGITHNTTSRRLGRKTRYAIGRWNVRYWLTRLEQQCEWNRVSFRTVSPWKTSQTCPSCGHVDRKNRNKEEFKCQNCDHSGNADVIAAKNILQRFLTGPYGAGCKSEKNSETVGATIPEPRIMIPTNESEIETC